MALLGCSSKQLRTAKLGLLGKTSAAQFGFARFVSREPSIPVPRVDYIDVCLFAMSSKRA